MKRNRIFRGDRLRLVREMQDLSQDDLEQQTGIGKTQIYRYETGRSNPSLFVLVQLVQNLNVTADYLLGLVDKEKEIFTEADLTPDERRLVSAFRRKDAVSGLRILADNLQAKTR